MTLSNEVDFAIGGIQHPNPLFDYLTTFVPRKLKSLFHYCDYLYFNCPQVFAVLNKFAIYPITEFTYESDSPKLREKYKILIGDVLKLKNILIQTGVDRFVYGNSFTSIYFPFKRFLVCPDCKTKYNIRHVSFKFKIKNKQFDFVFKCERCNKEVKAKVEDVKLRLPTPRDIHVIRWNPKYMEIESNPITGDREYFYEIPYTIQEQVKRGDRQLLETMPMAFIETIAQGKMFKFSKGKIFHMRTEGPAGIDDKWGFPSLLSSLKQFLYTSVLRKGNEAIALEYITPFRVLHPAQATANADPTVTISISNWIQETKMNLQAWRRDPLHLMFSPIPIGVTTMGGQGRALMVTGEIAESENSIIASFGVPREFIYGGLSATGSGVTLRMLENQLLNHTTQLVDMAQWITDRCGEFLGWKKIKIGLEPFKLVDDVQQKMALLQANQASGGVLLSQTSVATMFGKDIAKEREIRMQESLDEQRFQFEMQQKMQEMQNSLAERARSAGQSGQPASYDQQKVIADAEGLVQQLTSMDEGTRRSFLQNLEQEDYVMYSVVIQRWEAMQTQQQAAMRQQMQQQMAAPPPPGGM